ncbi:MAG: glycosyltransferase family 2 protein [Flavobacterium sp.]|nr:glycosyltransferase family 2 protein [Flavobacterium sp.]
MRIGFNPQKSEKKINLTTYHRVIVVVYIPNEEGFYKNSYDVFKLCLDSLVATINSNTAITIVNNGSYQKVTELLQNYLKDKKIDSLIHHSVNIGKIDALIGAARGAREQLITYSDSDILFQKGWQENVEKIFSTFSNVGSVSPISVRYGLFYGTSSVLKQIIFRKIKIKFEPIPENFDSYNKYLKSINWDTDKNEKKNWPVIERNNTKAIIGSGHQVVTISREILFKSVPTNPSLTLVGGDSEYKYVDEPIDKLGKLRLCTYTNFAFHMGNNLEDWMIDVHKNNLKATNNSLEVVYKKESNPDLLYSKYKTVIYLLRKKITKKVFKLIYKDYSL